jgi:hypothetical protein
MRTSPTQRSLAYLRKNGWTACVVEKFLPARGGMPFPRRIDAFGFGDILACNPEKCNEGYEAVIALVQTTTMSNMAAHRDKIQAIPEYRTWKDAGGMVILHGWRKIGPRGKRKTWQVAQEYL